MSFESLRQCIIQKAHSWVPPDTEILMETPLHCDITLRFCTNRNVVSFSYRLSRYFIHASLESWYFAVHQLFPNITVFNCDILHKGAFWTQNKWFGTSCLPSGTYESIQTVLIMTFNSSLQLYKLLKVAHLHHQSIYSATGR